ncbi:Aminomethyltransferase folate-binding domain-containing protein [Acrodontium crateriforme]|uniref:Iron-sulfur cluster assembly factor IBA57 homolog, mitochondrial n=1 Tax=Acrodontium crateriforme TaxID=150365 RepID=A0AAQ3R3L2_9PEZI|nr:Aminomethyltransferase folate-binding domain-containing protein [Acrodontium crateriforme]
MISSSPRAPYVCVRCISRQTHRLYSSKAANPSPPPASGATKLLSRRLISIHGSEAPKFLQGIITNNVRADPQTAGFYGAFLTASGRVMADVFVYPTLGSNWHRDTNKDEEQGFLVEVDSARASDLMKHLKKHKLRSKFKLRLLENDELSVWSVWDENDRWTAHTQSSPTEESVISLTDSRAPGLGKRILLPPSSARTPGLIGDVDEAPLEAYTVRRYLRGVPEGQLEIPWDDSLPMNSNIDIMGGIDFKKGCYLGQELTIRTHHTGVVRRRIMPVQLYGINDAVPETLEYISDAPMNEISAGVDIRKDDKRRKATGKLIANVGNIGLGVCRLEQMTDLAISSEGSSFNPDDRFLVQDCDGTDVGVKAFVPDWVRGRIRGPKTQKRVEP